MQTPQPENVSGSSASRVRATATVVVATLCALLVCAGFGPATALGAPSITINTPVDGATFGDSDYISPIDVGVTGADPADARCRWDDHPLELCQSMASADDPPPMSNGAHSFTAVITDSLGASAVAVSNFTVADTTAPTGSATCGANGAAGDLVYCSINTSDPRARLIASVDGGGARAVLQQSSPFDWTPRWLGNGGHTIVFKIRDGAGNLSAFSSAFSAADATAPSITIASPASGQTVGDDVVTFNFNSDDAFASASCRLDTLPPFLCWPGNDNELRNVPAGAHTLHIGATDNVGNQQSAQVDFSVRSSNDGSVSIDEPGNGVTYTAEPLLRLTLPPGRTAQSVRCRLNNGVWNFCDDGRPLGDLSNGDWSLDVRVIADNGDVLAATNGFTVADHSPPSLSVLDPTSGEVFTDSNSLAPSVDVTDTFADGSPSDATDVTCRVGGDAPVGCSNWTPGGGLANGTTNLTARAVDWVGNAAVKVVSFRLADLTAPSVAIVSPADGATLSDSRQLAVDFTVSEPSATVECRIDGALAGPCINGATWRIGYDATAGLTTGTHTLSVRAIDRTGNSSTASATVTVTDTTAPTLAVTDPAPGDTLGDAAAISFAANEPLTHVRCGIDGISPTERDGCALADGTGRMAGTFTPIGLPNGAHSFTIAGDDAAGNTGSVSISFTIADGTAPRVWIDDVSTDQADPAADSPTFVHVTTNDPGATLACRLDGGAWTACGDGLDVVWDVGPLPNGSHTADARATDGAGNVRVASAAFDVADTTAPWLTVHYLGQEIADGTNVPSAFDLTIAGGGQSELLCSVDGAAFGACAIVGGRLAVAFTTAGAHTVSIRAVDAVGNMTTWSRSLIGAAPPGAGGAPTETPPSSTPAAPPVAARAAIGLIKPRVRAGKVVFIVPLSVTLPAGADGARVCAGAVTGAVTVARKSVGAARSALRFGAGRCAAVLSFKIAKAKLAGKKATLTVSFAGSDKLAAFSVGRKLVVKRH